MEDSKIVQLYWDRDERAISATSEKYGNYCTSIARNILDSEEDAEECVNDTYLKAWNAMPPHWPSVLATFLGKITRNLSLNRYRYHTAGKRGGKEATIVLDELAELVSGTDSVEQDIDRRELIEAIDTFLAELPADKRGIFLCRYWYFDRISDIASRFCKSENHVSVILNRLREPYLQEEGHSWFYPSGVDNLKYLICREEEGNLSLWVFSNFEVMDEEELSLWVFEGFTDPVTAPYTYGEVLETIYGVDSAEAIASITAFPYQYNNTDLGKKIQQEVGTHTYTDREDIAAFYNIIVEVTCLGTGSENCADSNRFTYSFSADGQEIASIYGMRELTITLTDGTTIDSWNYTALSGSFFEYGSIFTEPLPEKAVYTLNEIFGIE